MELNERSTELAIMSELVKEKVPVTVFLTNGFQMKGVIARFDLLIIVLITEGRQNIIYKHSISSIRPEGTLRSAQPKA